MNDRSSWLRLVAEAEAFAFASPESFAWCREELVRDDAFYASGHTVALEKEFVARVRESAESRSLEAMQNLCAYAWYSEQRAVEPLHRRLVRLSESLLRWNGSSVTLALSAEEDDPQFGRDRRFHDVAARWRWLTLRMPADLLIAAVTATKPTAPHNLTPFVAGAVDLAPPGLGRLLQDPSSPVAQTHLHVGAALSTSTLWTALAATQRFDRFALNPSTLDQLSVLPFGSGEKMASMLMVALIARLFFADFLESSMRCSHIAPFHEWIERRAQSITGATLNVVGDRPVSEALRVVFAALEDGPRSLDGLTFTKLRALYRAICFDAGTLQPVRKPDRIEDPIAVLLRDHEWPGPPLPESWLALLGLRSLFAHEGQPAQTGPATFARCFWQYQRVRAIFHRFLTQEPGTAGLDWFRVHQLRLSPFIAALDPILPALALQHESSRLHMGAFEARTSPPMHSDDVRSSVRWFADALRSIPDKRRRPEIALVFHFIRTPLADSSTGMRFADPAFAGCRHRGWYQQQKIRATAIRVALERQPELLVYLRGLDVANLEYSVPTYAFRPLLVNTREASKSAAAALAPKHPTWGVRPLQVTVHAGEDYRRLVDGVRRMHELLRYHVLEPSDRVGHGLALGVDPERWCTTFVEVAQPRMDRLEDLLWEISAYRTGFMPSESGRHVEAEAEIEQLSRVVFGQNVALSDLIAMRDDLHSFAGECWLDGSSATFDAREAAPYIRGNSGLLADYLSNHAVYHRGCAPVVVRSSERESRMLRAAQEALRKALNRSEITVEANPSSNLLVGGMQSLQHHPVLRLDPPPGMPCDVGERVLVSLNSDDPTTFATSLADEYAHMYFALLRNGHGANDARAWVTRLREQGWRSRFSLECSRFPEEVMPEERLDFSASARV